MPKIKYFERFTSVVAELFLTSSSHHNQRGQASNRFSLVYVQSRECFLFPDFLWQTEYLKSNSAFLTKPIQCNFDARQLLYLFYTNDCFSCYFGTQNFSSFFFYERTNCYALVCGKLFVCWIEYGIVCQSWFNNAMRWRRIHKRLCK